MLEIFGSNRFLVFIILISLDRGKAGLRKSRENIGHMINPDLRHLGIKSPSKECLEKHSLMLDYRGTIKKHMEI